MNSKKITHCGMCPMYTSSESGRWNPHCKYMNKDIPVLNNRPNWCPLPVILEPKDAN